MKITQTDSNIIFKEGGLHIYLHRDINEKPESIFWGTYPISERVVPMSITARGLMRGSIYLDTSYADSIKQYCEVGPGFSGIFPYLEDVEFQKKPIIIDPAPYSSFLDFLGEIEEKLEGGVNQVSNCQREEYLSRIRRARRNLSWYLNSKNCRFINKTVGDAVVEEEGLIGVLDSPPRSIYSAEHFMWGVGTSDKNKDRLQELLKLHIGFNPTSTFLLQEDVPARYVYDLMLKPELREK